MHNMEFKSFAQICDDCDHNNVTTYTIKSCLHGLMVKKYAILQFRVNIYLNFITFDVNIPFAGLAPSSAKIGVISGK